MDQDNEKKKQKSKRALGKMLSRKRLTSSCYHDVPFARISETVTREPDSSELRVVEDRKRTALNDCCLSQRWTDPSSRQRITSERSENNASHELEKELLGSGICSQKKITIDQLPHPSRLRRTTKRKYRAPISQNISDVTKHIHHLKHKQSLCATDTLLEVVHNKQQNTEIPCKKYRIQVRPSSTEGIQTEENHNLAKCSNITPGLIDLLDALPNNADGFKHKGVMRRTGFLDDVPYNQTDIPDHIMSLHRDNQDMATGHSKATVIPENIPPGADNSLLVKTTSRTPLLDSIKEQSFLIDFKDAINQSRIHHDADRSAKSQFQEYGNNSFSNEPGILWDSPLMSSTPKSEFCQSSCFWSEDAPDQADMAPQLFNKPPLGTFNDSLGGDDHQGTFINHQPLWKFNPEDFVSQVCSSRQQNPWISPLYTPQLNHQSPEQELAHIHNSVVSSECCHSVDSPSSCQKHLFDRYDGENDVLQSQVENEKLDLWMNYRGNMLEE